MAEIPMRVLRRQTSGLISGRPERRPHLWKRAEVEGQDVSTPFASPTMPNANGSWSRGGANRPVSLRNAVAQSHAIAW